MRIYFAAKAGVIVLFLCVLSGNPVSGGQICASPFLSSSPSAEYAGVFKKDGFVSLPYRTAVIGSELPGEYAMLVFFHGIGERGKDNYSRNRDHIRGNTVGKQ